jgi:hypothetical protein
MRKLRPKRVVLELEQRPCGEAKVYGAKLSPFRFRPMSSPRFEYFIVY